MSSGARKRASVASKAGRPARSTARPPRAARWVARRPTAAALLEQPEAGDVLQEADAAQRRPSSLVKFAACAAGDVSGSACSRPDEQPRPGRDERRAGPRRAPCDDGRRGVVSADEVHGDALATCPPACRRATSRRAASAGRRRSRRPARPTSRRVAMSSRPVVPGDRPLRADRAGEVVHEQVGQQQQVPGAGELVAVVRGELEDRVERLELDAGDLVQAPVADAVDDVAVARRCAVDRYECGGAAGAAVVVEQAVVDAPRVDADRRDRPARRRPARARARSRRRAGPSPSAGRRRHRATGRVRVPVDDLDATGRVVEVDAAHADRRRAEVDGGDDVVDAAGEAVTDRSRRCPVPRSAMAAAR